MSHRIAERVLKLRALSRMEIEINKVLRFLGSMNNRSEDSRTTIN